LGVPPRPNTFQELKEQTERGEAAIEELRKSLEGGMGGNQALIFAFIGCAGIGKVVFAMSLATFSSQDSPLSW